MNDSISLDKLEKGYIQLNEGLLYEIIDKARKISISLGKLSKLINIPVNKLLKFHALKNRRETINIHDLKKLSNFLIKNNYKQYSIEELQNKIKYIGRHRNIINPKLPIYFSKPEGCSFLGDILTDGFFDSRLHVGYSNTDPLQILQNIQSINKLICNKEIIINKYELYNLKYKPLIILKNIAKRSSIKCSISLIKVRDIRAYTVRYSRDIGRFIKSINIPNGKRVYTNPSIPTFLFSASKNSIFKFLERVCINEAQIKTTGIILSHSIDITNDIPNRLKLKFLECPQKYKNKLKVYLTKTKFKIPNLIKDYKILFNKIGCNPKEPIVNSVYLTKKNEIHVNWKIWLTGKDLDIIKSLCNLNSSIKWLILQKRNNFTTRYQPIDRLNQIMELGKKLREFKSKDLANKLNLSQESINIYLKRAIKDNLITKHESGRNTRYKILV